LEKQFRAEIGMEADSAVVALAVRNSAELTMSAEMQRAAMIRNEPVDLAGLIRLEGVAQRAVADMRQLAREVRGEVQPSMTIAEHIHARPTQGRRAARDARGPALLLTKRDARRTLPAARGILRGDRRREAADDQG
jgi:hypothetical protein